MNPKLHALVAGDVTSNEVIKWLFISDIDTSENLEADSEYQLKSQFIPEFLNYIRDKISWLFSSEVISVKKSDDSDPAGSENDSSQDSPKSVNANSCRRDDDPSLALSQSDNFIKSSKLSNKYHSKSNINRNKIKSAGFEGGNINQIYQAKCNNGTRSNWDTFANKFSNLERRELKTAENSNLVKSTTENSVRHSQEIRNEKKEQLVIKYNMGCASYVKVKKLKNNGDGKVRNTRISNPVTNLDINSIEMFPPVGCQIEAPKARRRINPTPVRQSQCETSVFAPVLSTSSNDNVQSNSLFVNTPLQEMKDSGLEQEREMLRKTRNSVRNCCSSLDPLFSSHEKYNNSELQTDISQKIFPDPLKVHDVGHLMTFCEIYCQLITCGMVPNLAFELHFMFQILASVGKLEKITDRNDLFSSIHNCVYFVVCALVNQNELLNLLDCNTLRTILEIPYLPHFSKELCDFVKNATEQPVHIKKSKSSCVHRVFFQVDVDNRDNFPSASSFHSFRMQRDLFYELLREWQQQLITSPNLNQKFEKKVRHLISVGTHSTNFFHLARLIQSQLIMSCLGNAENDDMCHKVLTDFKRSFPDRFEKLEDRFLAPTRSGGPRPLPSFHGIELFFSEFLQSASSFLLNQHLIDLFSYKIMEMNDFKSGVDGCTEDEIKDKFGSILRSLRLFAKFFSYILHMPYKIADVMPSHLITLQADLRKHIIPPINISKILKISVQKQRLIVTVPWVVEYMSMIDQTAPYLHYNRKVFQILIHIYRGKYNNKLHKQNLLFLRLLIGWLLDTPYFPQEMIFTLNSPYQTIQIENSKENIDLSFVVDKEIIYACCPFLVDVKFLLDEYLKGIKSCRDVRKIKPVSMSVSTSLSFSTQLLELQLEENFFQLQSPSLKNTVEFVSERIASRIIQNIRNEITLMKLATVVLLTQNPELQSSKVMFKHFTSNLKAIVDNEIYCMCREGRKFAYSLSQKLCFSDVKKILPHLLPEKIKTPVINSCCEISARLAINKVIEWSDINIVPKLIENDIKSKINSYVKEKLTDSTVTFKAKTQDQPEMKSDFLIILRKLCLKVRARCHSISAGDISNLIYQISDASIDSSGNGILKTVILLSVDLLMSLIMYMPESCSKEIISIFLSFWQSCPPNSLSVQDFLCPRNYQFFSDGGNDPLSFSLMQTLLSSLFERELFTLQQLHSCTSASLQPEWLNRLLEKCPKLSDSRIIDMPSATINLQ